MKIGLKTWRKKINDLHARILPSPSAELLSENKEAFERRYLLKARGVDVDRIAERVSMLLDMPVEEVWLLCRYKHLMAARSLCFWAVRELGASMACLARRFNISEVAISMSVKRGGEISKREGYKLDLS